MNGDVALFLATDQSCLHLVPIHRQTPLFLIGLTLHSLCLAFGKIPTAVCRCVFAGTPNFYYEI